MSDFRPPIDNPAFVALCHFLLPLENWRARIDVEVMRDGLTRLRRLQGKRVVILSNHGDQYDPEVVLTLSKMMGEYFTFMAARECFDWVHGSVGWLFQNLGAYSIARGEADIESLKKTREILVSGWRKLVVFPEGEVTRQADLVLPLRKGSIRLFFEGQEDLLKKHPGEPLLIQPIGIRWRYRDTVLPLLHDAMGRIERQLRIIPPSRHILDRIEFASMTMAAILEAEYNAPHHDDFPFDTRIVALREHVLRSMALGLNVELPENEEHIDWFRRLNVALNSFVNADMSERSSFQKKLHKERAEKVERMRRDLIRMQQLIGISEHSDHRPATPERLANRVAKIEREVLGKVSKKGIRQAMIGVAKEPINLLDYIEEYESSRDTAVEAVTDLVHDTIQTIIDDLDVMEQQQYASA